MPPQRAQQSTGPAQVPFAGDQGRFFSTQKFGGINTQANRQAIGDEEFSWLENFIPIGDGNLRTLYSSASPLYTASGKTIINAFFFNIGATTYAAVFLSDGSAIQVATIGGGTTTIASAGTFYNGSSSIPACAQVGSSGIVIVATVASNGYWAWDGTLWPPGNATSPTWLNGGTPTAMPTGVSGTCVETFQSRVWIGNGDLVTFSGPSNGADFSGAVGGGSFASSDSFLRYAFGAIKQANGFLYLFGDSSINVISNVQTGGSPVATTFNNQNVDPQVGTPFPGTVQAFGRGLIFANQAGVYAMYGGAAEKISDQLDGLFANVAPPAGSPNSTATSAVALIFSIKCYALLVSVPAVTLSGSSIITQTRNVLLMWTGKKWFVGSQVPTLIGVATQEINSFLTAWGTDGTNLFQLFSTPSNNLTKLMQTKLWAGDGFPIIKQAMRAFFEGVDNSGSGFVVDGTIDFYNDEQSPVPGLSTYSVMFDGTAASGLSGQNVNGSGELIGATLYSTTSTDFTTVNLAILYRNQSAMGG